MTDTQDKKPAASTTPAPRGNDEQAQALVSVEQTPPTTETPPVLNLEYLRRFETTENYSLNTWLAQDKKEDGVVVYKA
ncbi:hypothetical protein FPQ18DRAFT_392699 [Pyronema domesticum]|nr:hypothetical protein FPQ18DRAFT_392699 [Pyronema domesticum]